jgi:pantoate--beta-alanine ligase
VQIIRDIATLRKAVAELRKGGGRVALVPTMGALHAGHMALVAEAQRRAEHVVVSIFVNPTQFGPGEDLDLYPRREAEDAAMLEAAGCAILWAPDVATMYPKGFATTVRVSGVTEHLEGAVRPGHFDGVTTVVAKLFGQVRPDIAVFGEKDYQQLVVIRRLVFDLDVDTEVVGVSIQRDPLHFALSSRNVYLSTEERLAARTLPKVLGEAAQAIRGGDDVKSALAAARGMLQKAGFDPIDYVELCDAETLELLGVLDRPARILAAVRLGKTRLIDNMPVLPPDL